MILERQSGLQDTHLDNPPSLSSTSEDDDIVRLPHPKSNLQQEGGLDLMPHQYNLIRKSSDMDSIRNSVFNGFVMSQNKMATHMRGLCTGNH